MTVGQTDYPILAFADPSAWREWLDQHHASERGVWIRMAKAATGARSVNHAQALEVALCYGWIDGQRKRYDQETFLQKFTVRGKRSTWSKRNREIVEWLIARGEMRPAGLAAIEAAKADGRWERAYDSPRNGTVPEDLQAALDANPEARARFESLSRSRRFPILFGIQTAIRPDTRARRIAAAITKLATEESTPPA